MPDLAKAIGMSVRNLRRYEHSEIPIKFIKGKQSKAKTEAVFYNAKVGLLIETLSDPKINEILFAKYNCAKTDTKNTSMQELERLVKVGKLIGTWYFNDNFKREMVK